MALLPCPRWAIASRKAIPETFRPLRPGIAIAVQTDGGEPKPVGPFTKREAAPCRSVSAKLPETGIPRQAAFPAIRPTLYRWQSRHGPGLGSQLFGRSQTHAPRHRCYPMQAGGIRLGATRFPQQLQVAAKPGSKFPFPPIIVLGLRDCLHPFLPGSEAKPSGQYRRQQPTQ